MKSKSADKIKMPSIDELLGVSGEESATDIEISRIHSFANHPFKVLDDDKMDDLVESIKQNGVLTPVLVRPDKNNSYEMISGHRRMHAAIKAGLETIPAIVRDIEDDEAIVIMVDANIQREELLPSEKAFAYKMKLGAMKRQAGRPPKNNSCQSGTNLRSDEELGNQVGESARSIQRYIRLTELIPDLLDYVDKKRLQFTVAVDISYIDKEIQTWLFEYIKENGTVKAVQVAALRTALEAGPMTQAKMISILVNSQPGRKQEQKITLSEKKLRNFFSDKYTTEDMENNLFLPIAHIETGFFDGRDLYSKYLEVEQCMENDRTNQHMIIQMKDAKLEEERIIYALWKDKKFDQVAEKLVLYFNKTNSIQERQNLMIRLSYYLYIAMNEEKGEKQLIFKEFYDSFPKIKREFSEMEIAVRTTETLKKLTEKMEKMEKKILHPVIYNIQKDIRDNYSEVKLLKDYAKKYNINATYLSELFVKECGKTFSDIVTDIKMDKAKNMLNEPDARVYEVAVKLGYHDGRYFSQLFKRCTGMTPKEFQKRCDKYE